MKQLFLFILANCTFSAQSQFTDSLHTAKDCAWMKPEEREMIYEINKLRTNPCSYLVYIEPLLDEAKNKLKIYGKGNKNYSVTYTTNFTNGTEQKQTDTTWHYTNEEEVKALESLIGDLKKLKPLSLLYPDKGIYKAAQKHAADQDAHHWQLMHTGSDGSMPWDRITKFSPAMAFGNENLAGHYPMASAREIVIQLLVDSGIPGYGHRYNLLDPQWTHVACVSAGLKDGMYQWIQNFGRKK
jgi:uncharacterized protein YkwD